MKQFWSLAIISGIISAVISVVLEEALIPLFGLSPTLFWVFFFILWILLWVMASYAYKRLRSPDSLSVSSDDLDHVGPVSSPNAEEPEQERQDHLYTSTSFPISTAEQLESITATFEGLTEIQEETQSEQFRGTALGVKGTIRDVRENFSDDLMIILDCGTTTIFAHFGPEYRYQLSVIRLGTKVATHGLISSVASGSISLGDCCILSVG